MRRTDRSRIIDHIPLIAAFIVIFSIAVGAIFSFGDLTASAEVTQEQIDRLRAEKQDFERKKREVQAKIDAIEFEHLTEMAKKAVLDQRIELTGLQIVNVNETIDQLLILIREKEYEVVIAGHREETQLQKYKNRVRDMEENGIVSYLELIFDSTSFSDMLARIDFIRDIMRADENVYEALQTARNETAAAKEMLEGIKAEFEDEKALLEHLEEELLEQLDQAHELILKLEADIETENQLHDRYTAEEARVQMEINAAVEALRKQQEEERLRQQALGGGYSDGGGGAVTGSGQLMWPMNGSVISKFGVNRGNGRIHLGLDIGAAHGVNVVAADSGTVVAATYNEGGLGYYVAISHGNGMTTYYGHMSSYTVSKGDYVSKGQLVGYNGSTGNATCPHLHFEVYVNGTRVDPLTKL